MNVPFINRFAQPPISQLSSLACKTVNFTDQNIKQKRGDPIELNLESLEMQKKKPLKVNMIFTILKKF